MSGKASRDQYRRRDNKLREYLANAALELETKRLEYHRLLSLTELLRHRVALLQEVADEASAIGVAQQLATRTLALAMQQPCMQRLYRQPCTVYPEGFAPTASAPSIDAMPLCLGDYNDAILERIACMTPADCLYVLRSYVERASPLALHAMCHGEASQTHQHLRDLTHRMTAFTVIHNFIAAPVLARHARRNLVTGEEDAIPEGWYQRVAQQLPVDLGLARLAAAAMAVVQTVELGASQKQAKESVCSDAGLSAIEPMLKGYGSGVTSPHMSLLRIMSHVALAMLNLPGLPIHKVAGMITSCWPFITSRPQILLSYLQRPEVASLLASEGNGAASSDASGSSDIMLMLSPPAAPK